jgi:hypothetical protein
MSPEDLPVFVAVEDGRDATFAALSDTIAFELKAQLADPSYAVVWDRINVVAQMVADQVLTEWEVSPRADSPTARR